MKNPLGSAVWLAIALACGTALAQDSIRWAPDLNAARAASKQFNVPLLIHFYGDDCFPCKTLNERVLNRPELIKTINTYFIPVRIDGRKDSKTAAMYNVHSLPTDVVLGPDGAVLDQRVCSQDARAYHENLQRLYVTSHERNLKLAAGKPASTPTANAQPFAAVANMPMSQNAAAQQVGFQQQVAAAHAATGAAIGAQAGVAAPGTSRILGTQSGQTLAANHGQATSFYAGQSPNALATQGAAPTENHIVGPAGYRAAGQLGGAVQGTQQLITGATTGLPAMAAQGAGLPARNAMPGQVVGATRDAGRGMQINQYDNLPQNGSKFAPAVEMTGQLVASEQGTQPPAATGGFIDNPHYQMQAEATSGVASRPAAPAQAAPAGSMTSGWQAVEPETVSGDAANLIAAGAASASTIDSQGKVGAGQAEQHFKVVSTPSQQKVRARVQASTSSIIKKQSAGTGDLNAESALPAMDGFCPITLRNNGAWVEGRKEFAVRHRGNIYWLSSEGARNKFLQDPDASSPALGGYDPLRFLNKGELVKGQMKYGLLEQESGRYLFFSDAASRQEYHDSYDRFNTALNAVMRKAGL